MAEMTDVDSAASADPSAPDPSAPGVSEPTSSEPTSSEEPGSTDQMHADQSPADAIEASDSEATAGAGDGTVTDPTPEAAWGTPGHPVFAAIAGFFAGMLSVTALPGGFAGLLRLLLPYDTAERLFPLVAIGFVVPIALLAGGRTRRFGLFMVMGMVVTTLVVLGVASLALYLMVRLDS